MKRLLSVNFPDSIQFSSDFLRNQFFDMETIIFYFSVYHNQQD
jgi:hypothetical protein